MKNILIIIAVIVLVTILGGVYMFLNLVDKSEPRIIKLEAPVKMVGVSMNTSMKTIYKDSAALGKEYRRVKNLIQNKKVPWAFVAISKDFSNNNIRWEYLMGDVVTSFDNVTNNLIAFEIPANTYAVFTIRPKFNLLWGPSIGLTKKYIFTKWLTNSKYKSDNSIVGDFEYHDDRSLGKKPSIDLYVAVKERHQ